MDQGSKMALFILALIIVASFILTGGFTVYQNSTTPQDSTNQTFILVHDNPQPSHQTLQLQTLTFTAPSPTSNPIPNPIATSTTAPGLPDSPVYCIVDTGQSMPANCKCDDIIVICINNKCSSSTEQGGQNDNCGVDHALDNSCTMIGTGTDCIAKPVIYLYPLKDTIVSVTLNIPGSIVESIPTYINGGWTVLAHPNGSLEYLGKTYSELYYESSVNKVNPPKQGFVFAKSQAEGKLKEITTRLGLIKPEQDEFLSYWLPRINQLNAPYLFISVIDQKEKDRIDNVVILPKPETKIEFLVYFKPVYALFSVSELKLPDNPPKRNGFTSVEWGGTIDTN
jgi:hypothetical protein